MPGSQRDIRSPTRLHTRKSAQLWGLCGTLLCLLALQHGMQASWWNHNAGYDRPDCLGSRRLGFADGKVLCLLNQESIL